MGGSLSDYQYTVEVPGTAKPGSTGVFLHPLAKPYLSTTLESGATTLFEIFQNSVEKFGHLHFLGARKAASYEWLSYEEAYATAAKLGLALRNLGLDCKFPLGIYSKNRVEWILMDLACISQSIASVPIYDMFNLENIEFIVNETNLKIIACSSNLVKVLLKLRKESRIPSLQTIIVFEDFSYENQSELEDSGLKLVSFNSLLELGLTGENTPPSADSVFTICYTSGTTGRRKGAMISHRNIVAAIAGILSNNIIMETSDCHLSYLPLAHMMERVVVHMMAERGASIGFYSGDAGKIQDDMACLKPTVFISVPRLFNRFYELIIQQFNSATSINKLLINKALQAKMSNYHNYKQIKSTVWDKLVFSSVRNALGGRIRFMITGSAPIAGEVLTFLRIVFSCPIVEGYGQTESCAASFVTMPDDLECGHIGGPIPNLEAKVIDVPDMKYFSHDVDLAGNKTPRGELCLRGPTVFIGYFKNDENTEEALDAEGWLHTGDIVIRLHYNGAFKIIDRKKNFFKLAQGEYVATEKIEGVYSKSEFISQILVYGDSFQSFLIAVVVPCEAFIRKLWGAEKGFEDKSFEEICHRDDLKNAILRDMEAKAEEAKLFGYERVKRIHLEHRPWSTANLLTPTLKVMRYKAKMQYQGVIAELYSEDTNFL